MPNFHASQCVKVVECDPDNIPPSTNPGGAVSAFLSRFVSLRDLCASYPYGMGIECNPDGRLVIRHPLSLMLRGPPNSQYLLDACRDRCVCVELGPDYPDVTTPQRPACVADVGQDVVAADVQAPPPQCTAPTTLYSEGYTLDYEDRHWCDEYWYGEPIYQDCLNALEAFQTFEDDDDTDNQAWFLGINLRATYIGTAHEEPPNFNQLPVVKTDGILPVCRQDLPKSQTIWSTENADAEYWWRLQDNAETVIEDCVKTQGIGGWHEAGDRSYGKKAPLGVYVYHIGSMFQQMLDIKTACTTDAQGNAVCEDADELEPPAKKPKTGGGGWDAEATGDEGQGASTDPQPPARQQCNERCFEVDDCDYANGCICLTNVDVPIHSSFGTFSCAYEPDLAAEIAATKVLGSTVCRGRCLLTSTTHTNSSAAWGSGNTTNDSGNTLNNSSGPWSNNSATWNSTSLEILAQPDQTYPQNTFACPCNCTYISPACCLSTKGIVWEDPTEKLAMTVQAPNGSVCCDETTGKWRKSRTVRESAAGDPACPVAVVQGVIDT
ncbi:MAG: hypothetical protein ASARMPREDX12_001710 [Alectoria sarmentosa]|nr:MAG: hypothetical protein ASARMPREDX12_001710 [Alectoria sarmentosa]